MNRRFFLTLALVLSLLAIAPSAWAAGCAGTGACYYYTTGGGATVNNWSDTTKWFTADAGAGTSGSVPTTADDVFFTASTFATAYTVTVDATANCRDMTWANPASGSPTLATAAADMNVYGSLALVSGMTFGGGAKSCIFKATSGTKTITSNTVVWAISLNMNGSGATFRLADNLSLTSSVNLVAGTFDPNGKLVTITASGPGIYGPFTFYDLTLNGTAIKTSEASLSYSITVSHNLVIAGNSPVNRLLIDSNTIGTARTITTGGAITLSNVDYRDITFGSTNSRTISSAASDGATGTRFLTAAAHGLVAGMNVMIAGTTDYNGTHAVLNVSDTTHYDIATAYVSSQAGTWTHDFSTVALATGGVGGGVCSGLVGLTPNVARTLYFHEAEAGANSFSTVGKWFDATNGGGTVSTTPPLMQDTAKFNADSFDAGSKVVTQDMPRIGSVDWTGATNIPTWTTSTVTSCFGSITLITATSGMILTATTQIYTLEGRGSYTITSAGNSWAKVINLNVPGGTITLQDSYSSSASLTIDQGTLTTNSNVTIASLSYNTILTGTVTLNLGAGTWTITSAPTLAWKLGTGTLTIGSITNNTIKFTDTSATTKAFWGRGKVYNNIWYAPGAGTGEFDIADGANTFADFKDDGSAAHSIKFTKSTTTTVASWNVGTASSRAGNTNVITLDTVDGAGTFLINQSVAGKVCATSLNITRSVANGAGVTWYAGATPPSVNGGTNTGWTFGGCAAGRKTLLGVGP